MVKYGDRQSTHTNTSGEYDYASGVEDRTDGLTGNEALDGSLLKRTAPILDSAHAFGLDRSTKRIRL